MEVKTMDFGTVSAKNDETSNNNAWLRTATIPAFSLFLTLAPGQMVQLQQAPAPVLGINRRATTINRAADAIPAVSTLVKSVREGFGFNITELATLFGVTRPTIYSWLKNESQPKREVLDKLQALNAATTHWQKVVADTDLSYLLDYTGPTARSKSIREAMITSSLDAQTLKSLIDTRLQEFQRSSARSREILGEALPIPKNEIPEGSQKMNAMWTKNANRHHSSKK
ncbi:MAG: helix-turn-helix domain-containing protein [Verrucomicrobiales bacterium]|nr:helix-turn-helix domain-containing protein [Verrucomicrobiales bacterium]